MKKSRSFIIAMFSAGLAFAGGAFGVFGEIDDAIQVNSFGFIPGLFSVYINVKNK